MAGSVRGDIRHTALRLNGTYFESDPPEDEEDKLRFGHSRDTRRDCVQVVIALIVTPAGFPLAYEVLPGNTADNTTLRVFLQKIEDNTTRQRIWVMLCDVRSYVELRRHCRIGAFSTGICST